jgi:hypothetical protein
LVCIIIEPSRSSLASLYNSSKKRPETISAVFSLIQLSFDYYHDLAETDEVLLAIRSNPSPQVCEVSLGKDYILSF